MIATIRILYSVTILGFEGSRFLEMVERRLEAPYSEF